MVQAGFLLEKQGKVDIPDIRIQNPEASADVKPKRAIKRRSLPEAIAGDLFRRAIPLMTPTDFAMCEESLERMESSYNADDVGRRGTLNRRYHACLYAAAGRPAPEEIPLTVRNPDDTTVQTLQASTVAMIAATFSAMALPRTRLFSLVKWIPSTPSVVI